MGNAKINVIGDRNMLREIFDRNVNEAFDKSYVELANNPEEYESLYPEVQE